ncbi:MAG: haloalkane dehalogenase [Nannocystales bacterium]
MDAFRTPDERFSDLPGFAWEPNYLEGLAVAPTLRLHYLDEGPTDAEHTFLCLHGEPSWSYLYRKMLPVFLETGARVVAPDFFGFGRSDKPVDDSVYTFDFHRDTLLQAIERLNLRRVTLVCQDWGGLLGLTIPMEMPDRFNRLIVMNTALAVGAEPGPGFMEWRDFVASTPDFDVGALMKRAAPGLSDDEVAAYDAPFDGPRSKAGVRRFPALVPITPDMDGAARSRQAVEFFSERWKGESFMAIGMQDPVLGPPAMRWLHSKIARCPEPMELPQAGHFVQEDGEVVARAALAAFAQTP